MDLGSCLRYYKRKEIQAEIVKSAVDKEVGVRFMQGGFGKRPDILKYDSDVLEFVKDGVSSFHFSEEIWKNPLELSQTSRKSELDELRVGWDLVLDIDCHFLDYSKIAADLTVKALKYYGIKSVSIKFSGNKGFHIGVPFEAFPKFVNKKPIASLFPEGPRAIAAKIKEMIKDHLSNEILKYEGGDFGKIIEKVGLEAKEITRYKKNDSGTNVPWLNAEPFLDIDTILISSRHLYRSPYSFNEKSGLVSIPIDPSKILEFDAKDAAPEKVVASKFVFLGRDNIEEGEASRLLADAFDLTAKIEEQQKESEVKSLANQDFIKVEKAIPEELFPPCMRIILNGMEDGKKRSMFILLNFFSNIGWDNEMIEKRMHEWNEKNPEPLRETLIKGHLRYHANNKDKILPPNCANKAYYIDMRVCQPDGFCPRIRNPVNYSILKQKMIMQNQKVVKEKKERKAVKEKKTETEEKEKEIAPEHKPNEEAK